MDNERFYPELTEKTLWAVSIVLRHIASDPDYLNDPECPYDGPTKAALLKLSDGRDGESAQDQEMSTATLEAEISNLFKDLKEWGRSLSPEDTSEKNTYYRLSHALLTDLIKSKERVASLRQGEEFVNVVLTIMEDELDGDQRTRVMDRLGSYQGK